jgi:hypothetical protein
MAKILVQQHFLPNVFGYLLAGLMAHVNGIAGAVFLLTTAKELEAGEELARVARS